MQLVVSWLPVLKPLAFSQFNSIVSAISRPFSKRNQMGGAAAQSLSNEPSSARPGPGYLGTVLFGNDSSPDLPAWPTPFPTKCSGGRDDSGCTGFCWERCWVPFLQGPPRRVPRETATCSDSLGFYKWGTFEMEAIALFGVGTETRKFRVNSERSPDLDLPNICWVTPNC